jgi:hypothetical protein
VSTDVPVVETTGGCVPVVVVGTLTVSVGGVIDTGGVVTVTVGGGGTLTEIVGVGIGSGGVVTVIVGRVTVGVVIVTVGRLSAAACEAPPVVIAAAKQTATVPLRA